MATNPHADEIRALPWVQSVVKAKDDVVDIWDNGEAFVVTSRPGVLKVRVEHELGLYKLPGEERQHIVVGDKLAEPFFVPMPSLKFAVTEYHDDVLIRMAQRPDTMDGRFLPYPAYDGHYKSLDGWDSWGVPCWGEWSYGYDKEKTWAGRAQYLGFFVQSAKAHRAENQYGASYAYFLGRLPGKHVKMLERPVPHHPDARDADEDDMWDWDD